MLIKNYWMYNDTKTTVELVIKLRLSENVLMKIAILNPLWSYKLKKP
jgi:hypothetical protein